jgi:hypothetical protein
MTTILIRNFMVAHACHPSYSRGIVRRSSSRLTPGKKCETLSDKGLVQPQYCQRGKEGGEGKREEGEDGEEGQIRPQTYTNQKKKPCEDTVGRPSTRYGECPQKTPVALSKDKIITI